MFHRGCINRAEIADYLPRLESPLSLFGGRGRGGGDDCTYDFEGEEGKQVGALCWTRYVSLVFYNKKCAFNLGGLLAGRTISPWYPWLIRTLEGVVQSVAKRIRSCKIFLIYQIVSRFPTNLTLSLRLFQKCTREKCFNAVYWKKNWR